MKFHCWDTSNLLDNSGSSQFCFVLHNLQQLNISDNFWENTYFEKVSASNNELLGLIWYSMFWDNFTTLERFSPIYTSQPWYSICECFCAEMDWDSGLIQTTVCCIINFLNIDFHCISEKKAIFTLHYFLHEVGICNAIWS